jgi:hypothetical protein
MSVMDAILDIVLLPGTYSLIETEHLYLRFADFEYACVGKGDLRVVEVVLGLST